MGYKLLLADDSITIQKVVGIIFANEDYELTVVDNGDAALEKAGEILPDIFLVDALMPGKTGYEVCEAIRQDPALRHIPLLLLSGAFEPFDEEKARQSGADDYISKPFESQHLIDKVKRLIELGKERAELAPVHEPAVPPPVAPPLAGFTAGIPETPAAAILSAPVADEPAESFFCPEEGRGEGAKETIFPFAEEVIEASQEDDLWGVFELEEVEEEESGAFAECIEEGLAGSGEEMEAVEAFSFEEDEEAEPSGAGVGTAAATASEFGAGWEPAGEQTFSFQEEETSGEVRVFSFDEPCVAPVEGEIQAIETAEIQAAGYFTEAAVPAASVSGVPEEESSVISPMPEADRQFAPEEEYVPVFAAAPPAGGPAAASSVSVSGATAISEEQLAAIVSRISRDIIEKIVWEVVPDLAETLIKEEIRKLKEGV
ncbi:MAG: response regulator [Geobacteraceae bacterium]|nr:MAG: response regulator [Geobacteraceae bacterium]